MSVEADRMSQPNDGDPDEVGRHRFTFRSADSAADLDDDDDLDDDAVVNRADEDDFDDDDTTVVHGTVVDEDGVDEDGLNRDPVAGATEDELQPTFTPVDDGPLADAPVADVTDPSAPTLSESDDVPVVPVQATAPVTEVPAAATTADATAVPPAATPALDPNGPLLGDAVGLRASWQQAQAGFVDDPRTAVSEAAELVEHTAQTLIGALQQRQRQLRTQWDNNGSADATAAGGVSDTEQLRHLMQDYRNLFNQLCQP
jgi:hypothetical protein